MYSSCGSSSTRCRSPFSTILPYCITTTRCASESITARSWLMNRHANPKSRCRSVSIPSTWACTETSRAEVGSSATSRSGLNESARAIETRCR